MSAMTEQPYLHVSGDGHAGPTLEGDLRAYCPAQALEAYDEYAATYRAAEGSTLNMMTVEFAAPEVEAMERLMVCEGLRDPHAFVRDMDAEGVAAQVIFAGGGNLQPLPWTDFFNSGDPTIDPELRALGGHIWNAWLADFCSVAPERLIGVMQIPIWDIDAAIAEVYWGAEHGLKAINFPGPRTYFPGYNRRDYEPFWAAVDEVNLPLVCHTGGGDRPHTPGDGEVMIFQAELNWFSRRGLAQLVFGGVFDRHPGLSVGFVEQRAFWLPHHLIELDSVYDDHRREWAHRPERRPSEYWRSNCFVGASFMAPFEAAMRDEIGLSTIVWGTDYPHPEGTWGNTTLAMRNTFAGIPCDEVAQMIGGNAVRVYHLDEAVLRPIADKIGPRPSEIDRPLMAGETPTHRGLAFREYGSFA
jgi:predicted TIM-barrel fold metal-dependent hydrolase